MSIEVVPYTKVDGVPTLKDSHLAYIYSLIEEQGLGYVTGLMSGGEFFEEVKNPNNRLFVAFFEGKVMGYMLLNLGYARFAFCHFVVFKEFWGKEFFNYSRLALQLILHYRGLDHGFLVDGLLALVPSENRLALRYAKKCGFKVVGDIPFGDFNRFTMKSGPATMLSLSRESDND
jgi:hypothetical protein